MRFVLFFILCPYLFFAQSGPAGVLNSVNNVFWLKANDGAYNDAGVTLATNGQSVRQINDQSGNSKHFSEIAVGQQPIFTTAVMNGFPTLRFDGNNDRLSNLTITSGNTANFFTVVRYSSTPFPNPGILQGSPTGLLLSTGANDKVVGMWVSNANQPWGRGIQTDNTSRNIPTNVTTSINANYIIENEYNGTSINQYVNLSTSGSIAYNGTLKSWTEFSIGRQGTETWAGDIAEVIAFNTNLNVAQRNIISNYLSSKYNITIANDLYAGDTGANGNYDFDLGGIGQSSAGNTNTSFNPSVTRGMGITYVSGFNDGDYILAAHNLTSANESIKSDVAGMTGTQNQRWNRIWYVDVTNTGANMVTNVSFDMSDGDVAGVVPANPANYVLLRRNGTSGAWAQFAFGATISGDVITFPSVTLTDGYYTIGTLDAGPSPLPIELLHFNASLCDGKVCLNWVTLSEINNEKFEIEKSTDGINFSLVANISSKAINGNSSTRLEYDLIDNDLRNDILYYRLKQIDLDKTYSYSNIVFINSFSKTTPEILIYLNPSSGDVLILLNNFYKKDNIEINIIDTHGKLVCSEKHNLQNSELNFIEISLKSVVSTGIYNCVVNIDGKNYSKKVIVN